MKTFRNTILIFILLHVQNHFSQNNDKVEYTRNEDNSVTFYYYSDSPASKLVMIKFNSLTNASKDIVRKTISGSGNLTTLRPINPKRSIGFSYSTRLFIGNLEKKPNHNFKYILPIKKGKNIKVRYLGYLGKKFGNKEPENWKSFQFLTSLNDTVFAIRKGVVIKVVDEHDIDKSNNKTYGYRSKSNSITIEHADGTLAQYQVLKKNSIMVNEGDIIYPSAPIAIAGTYDKEENSQLRLSIYYLNKEVSKLPFYNKTSTTLSNKIHIYSYVNPIFYAGKPLKKLQLETNKTYLSNYENNVIELEMTKRERKKWRKNKLLIKKNNF